MSENLGALGAGLTEEELEELHSLLQDKTLYGDDEIVYTPAGDVLRRVQQKVENEAKARKLWWAQ
jgi:hypothetical protein